MKKILVLLALIAAVSNAEEFFELSIDEALKSPLASEYILPDVKVEFGNGYKGDIITNAVASRKERGDIGDKKQKCEKAFLDAVNAFQRRVKKEHGSKVVNLVSFLYGKEFSSKTHYQCLYTNKFTVRLRGDIAK
ncbi:excinuclease ABC subunit A [Campylobacter curvus]|uniref:excinuclease ABC subunit A n=1 Tax=Campylobacter curvus TaxID=200 RepID=UPI00147077D3|nr:excinuclease ABC subunit A [Campylobacter curvus]